MAGGFAVRGPWRSRLVHPVGYVAAAVDAGARPIVDDKKGPLPKRMLVDAGSPRLQLPGGTREGREESSAKQKGGFAVLAVWGAITSAHLRAVCVRSARACSGTPGSRAGSARFEVVDVFGISRRGAVEHHVWPHVGWVFSAVYDWLNKRWACGD